MRKKFHGLKKTRIRQSWHKYNLYNLGRQKPQNINRSFFQQKWRAKSLTRAYHGEQIREKQWQRMFRPHMSSVVPMDHVYLAANDGSEQAAGRGSGADKDPSDPNNKPKRIPRTPYTNMVYAPIERRLDTAIFRALFASSTRQARQFVVHGSVKVNGKKMIYPGYLLNPGDMFQVEPERVLFATGAGKNKEERRAGRVLARKATPAKEEDADEAHETTAVTASEEGSGNPSNVPSAPKDPKVMLKGLLAQARNVLSDSSENLPAKRKQDLRAFQQTVKRTLARSPHSTPTTITDCLDAELQELTSKLTLVDRKPTQQQEPPENDELPDADKKALQAALREVRENPIDSTKPYATPWRPRDYMSAFAFIPRFLEVNQNICSAVYLRHPVARPGLGEVPTPFSNETNQLAFNWYLRRR
ncbi:MAG: mitochondrial 37S ribosomal protein nam9 [Candelina submexicana]|nr:MAG: mitochondrial 37S ribosomal protein nam9 [Candelina submexicana]